MKVLIDRIDNFNYSFVRSDKDAVRQIAKCLTFKNPDIYSRHRNIEKFDKRNLTFQIGMLDNVKNYFDKRNIKCSIFDYKFNLPNGIEIDSRLSGKYIHQRKAVEAFFKRRFGIICVPTRGGKTFIMSEILRIFLSSDKGNFLFLVDNTSLFNQAISDVKKFFKNYGGISIGEIKAGKIDVTKRFTVGMIQTIQSTLSMRCKDRKKRLNLQKYLKDLKFLSVDEIHDNFSDSKLRLYRRCHNIDYLLLLSATPYKSNTYLQNLKLKSWSGGIIYTISEETLRKRGVLSDYKVIEFAIDHNDINYPDFDPDCLDYSELRKRLIFCSDVRNNALLEIIKILSEYKLKTLVLFQSIEHGNIISSMTDIPFISGKDKEDKREKEKEIFLKKDGGVLLASNIFKKGITLPEAQILINVDEGLEDANTVQRKGRVIAATKTKDRSLIIDFIDIFDLYFSEHSETRLNTYIDAIGEDNVGILDVSSDDCFKTFETWIKKWFRL
jgi:superfamily II DNA or RNA helicase